MKRLSFIIISLLTITAQSEELGLRERLNSRLREPADRWRAEEAAAQAQGDVLFSLAAANEPVIRANQQISCNARLASTGATGGEVRALKMKFKDGKEQTFIPNGQRGVLWIDRKIHTVSLVNGKLVPSTHILLWGRRLGGWRFERQPELVKTCPSCDRFGDVESWSVVTVDLHAMAGCKPLENGPVISQTDPSAILTTDGGAGEPEAAR